MKRYKYYILLGIFIVTCVILIVSTYAWFSSTLNVEISEFRIYVDFQDGLQISLDGVNWGETVTIDEENIIDKMNVNYPSHTNRWSNYLQGVSSIGLLGPTDKKFSMFKGTDRVLKNVDYQNHDKIYVSKTDESEPERNSEYLAFDVYINNLSHSVIDSNLYILDDSTIENEDPFDDDITILSSLRIGFLIYDSVNMYSKKETIQSLTCDPTCDYVIYEPFGQFHGAKSIHDAELHGISLVDGIEYPTYAVYNEGIVEMFAGVHDSGIDFDSSHFEFQTTFNDIYKPIFKLPSGITKIRVYIWIEAQDVDIIEMIPEANKVLINLILAKDIYGDY